MHFEETIADEVETLGEFRHKLQVSGGFAPEPRILENIIFLFSNQVMKIISQIIENSLNFGFCN